jgi:hypothetical protein
MDETGSPNNSLHVTGRQTVEAGKPPPWHGTSVTAQQWNKSPPPYSNYPVRTAESRSFRSTRSSPDRFRQPGLYRPDRGSGDTKPGHRCPGVFVSERLPTYSNNIGCYLATKLCINSCEHPRQPKKHLPISMGHFPESQNNTPRQYKYHCLRQ